MGYETNGWRYETNGRRYETNGWRHETNGRRYETNGRRYETNGRRYETNGRGYETNGRRYETSYGNWRHGNGWRYETWDGWQARINAGYKSWCDANDDGDDWAPHDRPRRGCTRCQLRLHAYEAEIIF